MHDYTCRKCGTSFQSPKKNKQYCSHGCYAKRFAPVDLTCETCGRVFTVAYRFRGQKTCGVGCARVAVSKTLTTRETKRCLACDKPFWVVQSYKDKGKYCSYDCFLSTRKSRQPDVTKMCEYCENEFTVPFTQGGQRFCGYSCANSGENNGQYGLGREQARNKVPRWHAGLTKHDDPRLRRLGEKISVIIADKMVSGSWSPPSTGFKGEHYTGVKNGGQVAYLRSSYESIFARQLDADPGVLSWEHEPFRIPYLFEGSVRNYVPDFLVVRSEDRLLIEVKPQQLSDTPVNEAKRRAAESWCEVNGAMYLCVTQVDLVSDSYPHADHGERPADADPREWQVHGDAKVDNHRACGPRSVEKVPRWVSGAHEAGQKT